MTPPGTIVVLLIGFALAPLAATEIAPNERRSGYTFMAPDTQAIQDDDTANPGMLWVLDGEALWKTRAGSADKACADCHDNARVSMKGVAARYPAYDKTIGRPVNLEQRINICRARHQNASPLVYESRELLALTAFVAEQSHGTAVTPATTPELEPFV
jgi:L-cysteine S-thiosulfotransferase